MSVKKPIENCFFHPLLTLLNTVLQAVHLVSSGNGLLPALCLVLLQLTHPYSNRLLPCLQLTPIIINKILQVTHLFSNRFQIIMYKILQVINEFLHDVALTHHEFSCLIYQSCKMIFDVANLRFHLLSKMFMVRLHLVRGGEDFLLLHCNFPFLDRVRELFKNAQAKQIPADQISTNDAEIADDGNALFSGGCEL